MSSNSLPRPARFETWRLAAVYLVVLFVFSGLIYRLVYLQVLQGED